MNSKCCAANKRTAAGALEGGTMTDEKIIKGLKKRKRSSLEKAIAKYSAYVNVVVYNVIGAFMSREDIEEAAADTFIALWNSAEYLKDDGNLRGYLGVTARNRAINKLREIKPHEKLENDVPCMEGSPENRYIKAEAGRRLYDAVMQLGEPDSEIMLRYYYNGEKVREISEAMDIGASTIKTKLKRGREKLKELLTEGSADYE